MSDPMQNDPSCLVHAYVDGELDPAHALEAWNGSLREIPPWRGARAHRCFAAGHQGSGCRRSQSRGARSPDR